jgi:hypothetical protein
VRTGQRIVIRRRAHADHQIVANDADGHPITDHERDTAEHLSLSHAFVPGQHGADARRQRLVIGHWLPPRGVAAIVTTLSLNLARRTIAALDSPSLPNDTSRTAAKEGP